MGWLRTLYREVGLPRRWLPNLFGFPILLCLYIVKPFKFVKLTIIRDRGIGLLAVDADLFLRRLQLENMPKKGILYLGISAGKPANQQLLKMFKRKFFIIENPLLSRIVSSYALTKSQFCEKPPYRANEYYEFNNTERNLSFTVFEQEEGKELLNKMGTCLFIQSME